MSYQGYSQVDTLRALNTTLAKHLTDVEVAVLRNFKFLAKIESMGRVLYNQGGRGFDWPVQYRHHTTTGSIGAPTTFQARNLWKQAYLPYRGVEVSDAMSEFDMLAEKGPEGIVKVFAKMVERLTTSIRHGLGQHPYIDGNASGNESLWHGLESMFGLNGTVHVSTGAQRAANAADYVGYPSDTYAGLSTVLGNEGGANESGSVWPNGIADAEYDYWSPIVVNYTSSAFNGSADTFRQQGNEAVRFGLTHSERNSSLSGQVDTVLLARNLWDDFKNLLETKERIQVSRGAANSLASLGFKDAIEFDGREVSMETGISSSIGYGLNFNAIELCCMRDKLFHSEGPEYDMPTKSYWWRVSTLSNLKFNSPRNFFKLLNVA